MIHKADGRGLKFFLVFMGEMAIMIVFASALLLKGAKRYVREGIFVLVWKVDLMGATELLFLEEKKFSDMLIVI